MDHAYDDHSNTHRTYGGRHAGFERATASAIAWLRSRTHEHWIMFLAGLALGLLLG